MPTEEHYKNLISQLQKEIERLDGELLRQDEKLIEKTELLKKSILKTEHEKIVANLCREHEIKLSEIILQQHKRHNERGGGRKRIASKEIITRILELHEQGLSQAKIAAKVVEEHNIKIKRTTVGEIVRGNYKPANAE